MILLIIHICCIHIYINLLFYPKFDREEISVEELQGQISSFKLINDNGEEINYEVLCTFEKQETGENYMLYSENSPDENGNVKVYACRYDPSKPDAELLPIESEEDWRSIEEILDVLQRKNPYEGEK